MQSVQILSGEDAAREMLAPLADEARRRLSRPPRLVAVRANDDPGAAWYAKAQAKHCAAHGVEHKVVELGPGADAAAIRAAIERENADPDTDGILLFTPLPAGVASGPLARAIDPSKDAEGIHPANLGRLMLEGVDWDRPHGAPVPCTAMAAVALARRAHSTLAGKRAVVIGRSAIVGKPAALLLLGLHATVTMVHTRTRDPAALAREADVLIAAAGAAGALWKGYRPKWEAARAAGAPPPPCPDFSPLVRGDWIKRGAVVVDVGENEIPAAWTEAGPVAGADGAVSTRRAGDVERHEAEAVAGWLTAAKGGVGPLTNAFLLRNVLSRALSLFGE